LEICQLEDHKKDERITWKWVLGKEEFEDGKWVELV
jgi:hypothetical protein